MRAVRWTAAVVVLAVVSSAVPAASSSASPLPGCVRSDVGSAVSALVGPSAEITSRGRVAGFPSALALEPLVHPGVRHRFVRAGETWCHGARGFNSAWRASGRAHDAVAMASAFASLAAAPFFDDVRVDAAREVAPGVVALRTHARTNGIVARWRVAVDGQGVRAAAWRATSFAQPPFEARWEGLTALPGAERRYVRAASGVVVERDPLPLRAPIEGVGTVFAEARMSDGFVVNVRNGDTPLGVALDDEVGNQTVDFLRLVRDVAEENYEEFLSWGMRGGWTPAEYGTIRVDDALSLFCLACVLISAEFNIHVSSQAVPLLARLGTRYPDYRSAVSLVIGHEMFHNFQNAYSRVQLLRGPSMSVAYLEGVARFQETIHSYAHISHQTQSLVYATSSNGCNGYIDGSEAESMASAFAGHTYDACYVWMAFYSQHGVDGIVGLLEASTEYAPASQWEEAIGMIEAASGDTVGHELAEFALRALTGRGYEWGPAVGPGPVLDWAEHLDRWEPSRRLAVGDTHAQILDAGGLMALRLEQGGTVVLSAEGPGVELYRITATGDIRRVVDGEAIDGPPCVTTVGSECHVAATWLVAVQTGLDVVSVTVGLEAD